ncbi:MAG: hypothetical protein LBQ44_10425 [Treponema sp.]|jgi:hypothetical protein|nr:hypothetical protein [Treponema sp.]
MKKKILLTGILAVALVFGLTLVMGCSNPAGDPPGNDGALDPALIGDWKESGSVVMTISSTGDITWSGSLETRVNDVARTLSHYTASDWRARANGTITALYIPNNSYRAVNETIFYYELSGGTLEITRKGTSVSFATLTQ